MTRKVESVNEETTEKVGARTTVTSELAEGMTELSQQIAKLMATLTQTRQGIGPSSAQGNSLECEHGWWIRGRGTSSCPNYPQNEGWRAWGAGVVTRAAMGPIQGGGIAGCLEPHFLWCFRCQGWGHMARECPTWVSFKPAGGNWGNVSQPSLVTAAPANNRPHINTPSPDQDWLVWRWPDRQIHEKQPQQSHSWMQTQSLTWWDGPMRPPSCQWRAGDCIHQLRDTGLQCELWILQMNGPESLPSWQATQAIGYQRPPSHTLSM